MAKRTTAKTILYSVEWIFGVHSRLQACELFPLKMTIKPEHVIKMEVEAEEAGVLLIDPCLEVEEVASHVVYEVQEILGLDQGGHPFVEDRVDQVESFEDHPCCVMEDHPSEVGVEVESLLP